MNRTLKIYRGYFLWSLGGVAAAFVLALGIGVIKSFFFLLFQTEPTSSTWTPGLGVQNIVIAVSAVWLVQISIHAIMGLRIARPKFITGLEALRRIVSGWADTLKLQELRAVAQMMWLPMTYAQEKRHLYVADVLRAIGVDAKQVAEAMREAGMDQETLKTLGSEDVDALAALKELEARGVATDLLRAVLANIIANNNDEKITENVRWLEEYLSLFREGMETEVGYLAHKKVVRSG